jgi:predicted Zn finger-like uncharacterized protein
MLTQCPSCNTLFRVTATILKMGHGQVRCGKCRTQFDALESIQDEEASNAAAEESEAITQSEIIEFPKETHAEESPAQSTDVDKDTEFEDAVEIELSADGEVEQAEGSIIVVESQQESFEEHEFSSASQSSDATGSSEELDASSDSEMIDLSEFVEEESAGTQSEDNASLQDDSLAVETTGRSKRRNWLRRSTHTNGDDQFIANELAALSIINKPKRATRRRMWTVASVALVLVWVIQIVHHHRDDLVRNASIGSTVTRVYHALGLTLTPRWDLAAYELQQWGVVSDPKLPETLRVRASVTNRAQFSQPYPLIRLELQDRWGAPVAMRVFDTEDYLPEKSNANRLLAPKQRANAEIVIADPGADAVGFQIHACMRYQQQLSCSDE